MSTSTLPDTIQPLLTKKEAAEFLNISVWSLEKLIRDGGGPPRYRVGGRLRFIHSELLGWVTSGAANRKSV